MLPLVSESEEFIDVHLASANIFYIEISCFQSFDMA